MIKIILKLARRLTKEQRDILKKFVAEKKEIPIRIVYTQKYWDKIAMDSSYSLASRELGALSRSVASISKFFKNKKINIIHLGVGNGVEVPFLIDAIGLKNIDTYSIVDVNRTMLDISESKIKKRYKQLRVKKFQKDIETYGIKEICKETRQGGSRINLIVLIANGVLFSNDDLAKDIIQNMKGDDFFLLSLELYQKGKDEEIKKPYLIKSVLDLLVNGVKILGYKWKYEYFDAEINRKTRMLEVYFSPEGNRKNKLLVLRSYKPDIKHLMERTSRFGFVKLILNEYRDIHTCVVLYNKK